MLIHSLITSATDLRRVYIWPDYQELLLPRSIGIANFLVVPEVDMNVLLSHSVLSITHKVQRDRDAKILEPTSKITRYLTRREKIVRQYCMK